MYTILLCALITIDVFFVAYCATTSKPGRGIFGIGAGFAALYFLGVPVLSYVRENWQNLIAYTVAYILIGMPWSLFKWWRFALDSRKDLKTALEQNPLPVQGKGVSEIWDKNGTLVPIRPDESAQAYRERKGKHIRSSYGGPVVYIADTDSFELLASRQKGRIIAWLSLWPFSMVATAVEDLIVRLWDNIYEFLTGIYKRIANSVFADMNKKD